MISQIKTPVKLKKKKLVQSNSVRDIQLKVVHTNLSDSQHNQFSYRSKAKQEQEQAHISNLRSNDEQLVKTYTIQLNPSAKGLKQLVNGNESRSKINWDGPQYSTIYLQSIRQKYSKKANLLERDSSYNEIKPVSQNYKQVSKQIEQDPQSDNKTRNSTGLSIGGSKKKPKQKIAPAIKQLQNDLQLKLIQYEKPPRTYDTMTIQNLPYKKPVVKRNNITHQEPENQKSNSCTTNTLTSIKSESKQDDKKKAKKKLTKLTHQTPPFSVLQSILSPQVSGKPNIKFNQDTYGSIKTQKDHGKLEQQIPSQKRLSMPQKVGIKIKKRITQLPQSDVQKIGLSKSREIQQSQFLTHMYPPENFNVIYNSIKKMRKSQSHTEINSGIKNQIPKNLKSSIQNEIQNSIQKISSVNRTPGSQNKRLIMNQDECPIDFIYEQSPIHKDLQIQKKQNRIGQIFSFQVVNDYTQEIEEEDELSPFFGVSDNFQTTGERQSIGENKLPIIEETLLSKKNEIQTPVFQGLRTKQQQIQYMNPIESLKLEMLKMELAQCMNRQNQQERQSSQLIEESKGSIENKDIVNITTQIFNPDLEQEETNSTPSHNTPELNATASFDQELSEQSDKRSLQNPNFEEHSLLEEIKIIEETQHQKSNEFSQSILNESNSNNNNSQQNNVMKKSSSHNDFLSASLKPYEMPLHIKRLPQMSTQKSVGFLGKLKGYFSGNSIQEEPAMLSEKVIQVYYRCDCVPSTQPYACKKAMEWINASNNNGFDYYQNKILYQNLIKLETPSQCESQIEKDISRTFPGTDTYMSGIEGQSQLQRVLIAFSKYDQTIGYVQGMNFIVGSVLMHCSEDVAFWLFVSLIEDYEMRDIYQTRLPGLYKHSQVLELLQMEHLGSIYRHLNSHNVTIEMYASDWIFALFSNIIPITQWHNFLDQFFIGGWTFFYKFSLSFLKSLQRDILEADDISEILSLIKLKNSRKEEIKHPGLDKSDDISANGNTNFDDQSDNASRKGVTERSPTKQTMTKSASGNSLVQSQMKNMLNRYIIGEDKNINSESYKDDLVWEKLVKRSLREWEHHFNETYINNLLATFDPEKLIFNSSKSIPIQLSPDHRMLGFQEYSTHYRNISSPFLNQHYRSQNVKQFQEEYPEEQDLRFDYNSATYKPNVNLISNQNLSNSRSNKDFYVSPIRTNNDIFDV